MNFTLFLTVIIAFLLCFAALTEGKRSKSKGKEKKGKSKPKSMPIPRPDLGPTACFDDHPMCKQWAAKGDCTKKPKYMGRVCRKSCQLCHTVDLNSMSRMATSQYQLFLNVLLWMFILAGIGTCIKIYFGGARCQSKEKLTGKTVIITGGNSGIGKETAKELAWRGARVILACRNPKRGLEAVREILEATGSKDVDFKKLDLASYESIREFAKEIITEESRVDILINNAGAMFRKLSKTRDGQENTFQTNYLGHFLLTNLLLDKMKECGPSRIINVTGRLYVLCQNMNFDNLQGEKSYTFLSSYCLSKIAQIMFTRELAKKLEGSKVTVNCLHPGVITSTDILRDIPFFNSRIIYSILSPFFYLFCKTITQGAQTSIYCAVEPSLEKVSGKFFMDCQEHGVTKLAEDDGVAKKLWEVSERLTGLTE